MNKQQLAEIKARADAATCGPWTYEVGEYTGNNWLVMSLFVGSDHGHDYFIHITTDHVHASEYTSGGARDDAIFITHAREDVPALIAEVERLTLERDASQA